MKKPRAKNFSGFKDYIGHSAKLLDTLSNSIRKVAERNNFMPTFAPIIDPQDLYTSSLGASSDIIQKEMFHLQQESLVLRPEGTANLLLSIARSNAHKAARLPLKAYYFGPMFRHERPQLGRYRQFWQFGFELIDSKQSLWHDVEILGFCYAILQELGLADKVLLQINNIGLDSDRRKFNAYLAEHFSQQPNNLARLSHESRMKLAKNPLRVLDSKDPADHAVLEKLKPLSEFVSSDSARHFEIIQANLQALEIPFIVNPRLVRGLDYYNDLCFECVVKSAEMKAQNAVIAGGRYDKLFQKMPVKLSEICGIGFAVGLDRILDLFPDEMKSLESNSKQNEKIVGLMLLADKPEDFASVNCFANQIANKILCENNRIKFDKVCCSPKNFAKKFEYFEEKEIRACVIIGPEEVGNQSLVLRNIVEHHQKTLSTLNFAKVLDCLDNFC